MQECIGKRFDIQRTHAGFDGMELFTIRLKVLTIDGEYLICEHVKSQLPPEFIAEQYRVHVDEFYAYFMSETNQL